MNFSIMQEWKILKTYYTEPLPKNFQKSLRCSWIPLPDELNIKSNKEEIITQAIQQKTKSAGKWEKERH